MTELLVRIEQGVVDVAHHMKSNAYVMPTNQSRRGACRSTTRRWSHDSPAQKSITRGAGRSQAERWSRDSTHDSPAYIYIPIMTRCWQESGREVITWLSRISPASSIMTIFGFRAWSSSLEILEMLYKKEILSDPQQYVHLYSDDCFHHAADIIRQSGANFLLRFFATQSLEMLKE